MCPGAWFAPLLAERLNQPSPRRMMKQMSVGEWVDWFRRYQKAPWGAEIENFRSGQICAAIMNSTGRYKRTFKPSDFYPARSGNKPQTVQDHKRILQSLMVRHGSK